MGEGNNPNAVGYIPQGNYSALVVDYHESQFLYQLNQENIARVQNPKVQLPSVPSDALAYDRYAYSLNNPVKYNDPSGHCIWDLCIMEGIGLVELAIMAVATVATIEATRPGRPEAFAQSVYDLGEQTINGINAVFANQRNDENQEALVDLAKEAKKKGGVSEDEAQTLVEWGKEYNVPSRGPETHPDRPFNNPHIHVGPVGHIQVIPK
jgi:hypothetical protein